MLDVNLVIIFRCRGRRWDNFQNLRVPVNKGHRFEFQESFPLVPPFCRVGSFDSETADIGLYQDCVSLLDLRDVERQHEVFSLVLEDAGGIVAFVKGVYLFKSELPSAESDD